MDIHSNILINLTFVGYLYRQIWEMAKFKYAQI
jgi:hypothetical protein